MTAAPATAVDPVATDPGPIAVLRTASGHRVRYLDRGAPEWTPFVFFGGLATSVGAFTLTEFLRREREALALRAIAVERNGFGATPLDPRRGYAEAADDVLAVLDALGIGRFSVVAISGGGPFAAALAVAAPARVRSLHLVAAVAGSLIAAHGTAAQQFADAAAVARAPDALWTFPADSPVHAIPRFAAAARAEGRRALPDPEAGARAVAHEWALLTQTALPDLAGMRAPAYLYSGGDDAVVPRVHAEAWRAALPRVVRWREYPGEGHEIPYRHWDDVLADLAAA